MSAEKISKNNIKQFIALLAETYGKEVTPTRCKAYELLLSDALIGKPFTLTLKNIASDYAYFPTPRQVLDMYAPKPPTAKENAERLVDHFIAHLEGRVSYEEISKADREYCKKRFGADRYSFNHGAINLTFARKEWVEKATNDFEHGVNENLAIESPRVLQLLQGSYKNEVNNDDEKT